MCSRYELKSPPEKIIERFGLTVPSVDFLDSLKGPEIRPTDSALVISLDQQPEFLPWGLEVGWQKSPVINARAETAEEKSTFQPLLNRRVVVPASAYFEWRKDGREKLKTRISMRHLEPFGMAGLRSDNRFVILTCCPADSIAHIHTRMPVILDQAAEQEWLNPDRTFEEVSPMLVPYAGAFELEETPRPQPAQADLFG